jgi:hypothetical protein
MSFSTVFVFDSECFIFIRGFYLGVHIFVSKCLKPVSSTKKQMNWDRESIEKISLIR